MNKLWAKMIILVVGVSILGCTQKDKAECAAPVKSVVNPNGDSELALLMRSLFDESMIMRQEIEAGKAITFTSDPEDILTAHATEPAKAASPEYKAMGQAYIAAVRALQSAAPEERKPYFQGMVHSCVACHEQLCPGPTRKINRLFFEEI